MAKYYIATKDDVLTLGQNIEPLVKSQLSAIFDEIQSKGGTVPENPTLADAVQAIRSIPGDRFDVWLKDLGLSSISDNSATALRPYAFYNCNMLKNVSFPNVRVVDPYTFSGCRSLTSVYLPNVSVLQSSAFSGCTSLTSISLPNVTSITGSTSFDGCTALERIDLPNFIGGTNVNYTFRGCTSLKRLTIPNCTSLTGTNYWFNGNALAEGAVVDIRNILSQNITKYSAIKDVATRVHPHVWFADGWMTYENGAWELHAYPDPDHPDSPTA